MKVMHYQPATGEFFTVPETVKRKVYMAAPLRAAPYVRDVAGMLEAAGYVITSAWHDTALDVDPAEESVRRVILAANRQQIDACDVVLAVVSHGTPRATFCEIGEALAKGKRVVWWHGENGEGRSIYDADERVVRVTSFEQALQALGGNP